LSYAKSGDIKVASIEVPASSIRFYIFYKAYVGIIPPLFVLLEAIAKPQIAFEGKAEADDKAKHTRGRM
jgi:hypothetical protein